MRYETGPAGKRKEICKRYHKLTYFGLTYVFKTMIRYRAVCGEDPGKSVCFFESFPRRKQLIPYKIINYDNAIFFAD
jgi:hypothetical protein